MSRRVFQILGWVTGVGLLLVAAGCASGPRPEWITLFDGTSLAEWHQYGTRAAPKWTIEDGALRTTTKGRDIASNRTFKDFELEFEWRISAGGNSGVMFRVEEVDYESGTRSGPEFQVLDDERHKDGRSPLTSAGSLYAMYAPARKATKPAGEWNRGRIVVKGNQVQFWLNGIQTVDAVIGSEDWESRRQKGKFATMPRWGRAASGSIVLQDHDFPVWYRHIRIRPL